MCTYTKTEDYIIRYNSQYWTAILKDPLHLPRYINKSIPIKKKRVTTNQPNRTSAINFLCIHLNTMINGQ